MNAVFFGIKRAFHGALRIMRHPLACLGLTSARFDMLYAMLGPRWMLQSQLRRVLGVTAPTVSRMLRSLEALGLVSRCPSAADRRQREVRLTSAGLRCIRLAFRQLVGSGAAQLAVDCALTHGKPHDEQACFNAMCCIDDHLAAMANQFRDTSSLSYPWHPDD